MILAALVAIIGMGAIMNSCKKDENAKTYVEQSSNNNVNISARDISILNNIKNFKKKVDFLKANPAIKSGETMSVDSAIWYIDASFNYTYSFINERFEKYDSDEFLLTIPKTNGEINLNDISTAFYEMKDKTVLVYDAIETENKRYYSSHFEIVSNTASELVLKTTVTIGSKSNDDPPYPEPNGPFEIGEDWLYGEMLGDCSGGSWGASDAAEEIEDEVINYREQQDENSQYDVYYTDPGYEVSYDISDGDYMELFLNPYDNQPINYRDYYILRQEKDEDNGIFVHTCILNNEMNHYYYGAIKVVYEIIPDNSVFGVPENLSFYDVNIVGKGDNGPSNDPGLAYHIFNITYKEKHFTDPHNPINIK